MRTRLTYNLAAALVAIVVGSVCQPSSVSSGGSLSPAYQTALADTIRQMRNAFVAAASRLNVDETFGLFSRSPGFAAADNGTFYTSADRVRDVYRDIWRAFRAQDIRILDSKTVVLSPNAAVDNFVGTFAPTDLGGTKAAPYPFDISTVWVRETGGWKILQIHQSFPATNR